MAMLAIIATAFSILVFSGISSVIPFAKMATGISRSGHRQPDQYRPTRIERDSIRIYQRNRQ